ncbi:acyltransferase [Isosphaeraceae bacterium EP7]
MTSTTMGSGRYAMIDAVRGLVCVLVVVDHAGIAIATRGTPGDGLEARLQQLVVQALTLGIAPSLFFVLSGFCVAAGVESARSKGGSPVGFMLKRLWRTFPPYWAALMVFAGVVLALDVAGLGWVYSGGVALQLESPWALSWPQWVGNLTLSETWRPSVFGGGDVLVFTRVGWSLCYQEQFYLLCVLAWALVPRGMHGALAVATIGAALTRAIAVDIGAAHRIEGTLPLLWHEFAIGLAVYWRLRVASTAWARRAVDFGLAGLVVACLASGSIKTAAAAGLGLLLILMQPWDARLVAVRAAGPLRACGRRCYSIYLVHLPFVTLVNVTLCHLGLEHFWGRVFVLLPAATAVAVAAGWAFHHVVERRFMDLPTLGLVSGPWTRRRVAGSP